MDLQEEPVAEEEEDEDEEEEEEEAVKVSCSAPMLSSLQVLPKVIWTCDALWTSALLIEESVWAPDCSSMHRRRNRRSPRWMRQQPMEAAQSLSRTSLGQQMRTPLLSSSPTVELSPMSALVSSLTVCPILAKVHSLSVNLTNLRFVSRVLLIAFSVRRYGP